MKSYPELMAQFYDEFPDAVGFVTFRNALHSYPDINDSMVGKAKRYFDSSPNASLLMMYKK